MQLSPRPAIYELPSYSLTSDLLGFIRCGLQYRYTRIGRLPSTRPVQLWFGQFIHGVLEESYRRYDAERRKGGSGLPPWPDNTVEEICSLIKDRLAAQGLAPGSDDVEELGDARAARAINELGPEMFPLISRAEIRLTGSRPLPFSRIPKDYQFREADRYEMVGVIDVITNIELDDARYAKNRIVRAVLTTLPAPLPPRFEVIVDYKGMRRPPRVPGSGRTDYWAVYGWQLQTYASLRGIQPDSLPVQAGVIVYLNELQPTAGDIELLKQEMAAGTADVYPAAGTADRALLDAWTSRQDAPEFSLDYRLSRAIRVDAVSEASIGTALEEFDDVVARIEVCRGRELRSEIVLDAWEKNASDLGTCAACDSRTYCPDYGDETRPRLPGVKVRPRGGA